MFFSFLIPLIPEESAIWWFQSFQRLRLVTHTFLHSASQSHIHTLSSPSWKWPVFGSVQRFLRLFAFFRTSLHFLTRHSQTRYSLAARQLFDGSASLIALTAYWHDTVSLSRLGFWATLFFSQDDLRVLPSVTPGTGTCRAMSDPVKRELLFCMRHLLFWMCNGGENVSFFKANRFFSHGNPD